VVCHKWQDMGSAVHEGMQLRRRPPRFQSASNDIASYNSAGFTEHKS
jgi:hypothetical protein